MLQKIVVTLDRWSVPSLSRCVHTLDQVELDSQYIYNGDSYKKIYKVVLIIFSYNITS